MLGERRAVDECRWQMEDWFVTVIKLDIKAADAAFCKSDSTDNFYYYDL